MGAGWPAARVGVVQCAPPNGPGCAAPACSSPSSRSRHHGSASFSVQCQLLTLRPDSPRSDTCHLHKICGATAQRGQTGCWCQRGLSTHKAACHRRRRAAAPGVALSPLGLRAAGRGRRLVNGCRSAARGQGRASVHCDSPCCRRCARCTSWLRLINKEVMRRSAMHSTGRSAIAKLCSRRRRLRV